MSRRSATMFVLQRNMTVVTSLLAACGGDAADVCTRDDECASGFCKADGTCGPASDTDAMAGDGMPGDGATALCTPNHDGTVTRDEVPLAAGKMANFRIATDASFDTAGTPNGDGTRTWNLN